MSRSVHLPLTQQVAGLLGWLLAAFATAAIGAVASVSAGSFYAELTRPPWAPPGWLFGPVWSALYTLMGISAWLVWRHHGITRVRGALLLFTVQLAANALWSWLFFAWQLGALAFAEVVLLCCLILATVIAFWRINILAAALLMPYLAWVCFASALTFSIWQRNPGLLS